MKMINVAKLLISIIIVNFSFCQVFDPKQNQKNAFPNTFESITSSKELGQNKFRVPILSRSLYELNPTKKITKQEFIRTIKYVEYNLSKGELEQIFFFVDVDHNELIDQKEWDKFVTLYIQPFEACNKYNDEKRKFPTYLLTEEQFTVCFNSDPKSKILKFRRRDKQSKKFKMMMETVSSRGDNKINFNEYLFIKRVLFSWMRCQSHIKFMAESHFNCGLKLAVPNKILMKMNMKTIYNTGLKYQYKDYAMIQLDFLSFLRISHYTNVFTFLNMPSDSITLEKSEFIKGIREDRLPNNFEESDVEIFYKLTDNYSLNKKSEINFESFCFFFHILKLFNKYSIEKPNLLNKEELFKLLEDKLTPVKIAMGIDKSFTNFLEKDYQEASLVLQRFRPNEKNFFFSFRQDGSLSTRHSHYDKTINSGYYDKSINENTREVFFNIFKDNQSEKWTKLSILRAFQLANLFIEISEVSTDEFSRDKRHFNPYLNTQLIIKNLPKAYETANPPISMQQRKNFIFYKNLPQEISLDMLNFLMIENFSVKLFELTGQLPEVVGEANLKLILKNTGMENIPDTVLDLSKKGYDSLRRRIYFTRKSAGNIFLVQSVAAEHKRTRSLIDTHKLKKNKDISRLFPLNRRRFQSTPLVR